MGYSPRPASLALSPPRAQSCPLASEKLETTRALSTSNFFLPTDPMLFSSKAQTRLLRPQKTKSLVFPGLLNFARMSFVVSSFFGKGQFRTLRPLPECFPLPGKVGNQKPCACSQPLPAQYAHSSPKFCAPPQRVCLPCVQRRIAPTYA